MQWKKWHISAAMALGAFLCGISTASACTLSGLQYVVKFAPQTATVTADEEQRIVQWFLGWRDGRGIHYALVFSESVKGDDKAHALSIERLHAVRDVLTPLNKDSVDIRYGDALRDEDPAGPLAAILDEVEIAIQPACAKTNTCCPVPISK